MSSPAQRSSPVVTRQATDAGIELIQLCHTINADGRLLAPQITILKQWSARHCDVDLPSRDYVMGKLDGIIAGGSISNTERVELQRAIEAVLPPEVRRLSTASVHRIETTRTGQNLPIAVFEFMAANPVSDDTSRVLARYAVEGDEVLLVRDPSSTAGRHSLIVRLVSGHDIGQVPDVDARELALHLDQNLRYRARLRSILTGGHVPIAVVVTEVYDDDADVAELRRGVERKGPPLAISTKTPPHGTPIPRKRYTGAVLSVATAFLILLAVALLR